MPSAQFSPAFVSELNDILRSETFVTHYDSAGNEIAEERRQFTGEWELCSLEFVPDAGMSRATALFRAGAKEVIATIDASDFQDIIGSHDPEFNSTEYSDVAVLVSILVEEQILIHGPSDLKAEQVRICPPALR